MGRILNLLRSLLLKVIRLFITLRLGDAYWAKFVTTFAQAQEMKKMKRVEGGSVFYEPFNLTLIKGKSDIPIKDYRTLYRLKAKGATFAFNDEQVFTMTLNGIHFHLFAREDLGIVEEIFQLGYYDMHFDRPTVVVDMGMNVGIASLFFAAMPQVTAVYGYELIPETADYAKKNFAVNPTLAPKIKPHAYGLARDARTFALEYDTERKTIASVYAPPQPHRRVRTSQVELREVVDEMQKVLNIYRDENVRLVLKIDTEGAEYEIIPALAEAHFLEAFHVIVLEWHYKGLEPLLLPIQQAGFQAFSHPVVSMQGVGMLYGYRMC